MSVNSIIRKKSSQSRRDSRPVSCMNIMDYYLAANQYGFNIQGPLAGHNKKHPKKLSDNKLFIISLEDLQKKISAVHSGKCDLEEVISAEFYSKGDFGYRIECLLEVYKDILALFLRLLPGKYDDELEWPFKSVIDIRLLNQVNNTRHKSCRIVPQPYAASGTHKDKWIRPQAPTVLPEGIDRSRLEDEEQKREPIGLSLISLDELYEAKDEYLANDQIYIQFRVFD